MTRPTQSEIAFMSTKSGWTEQKVKDAFAADLDDEDEAELELSQDQDILIMKMARGWIAETDETEDPSDEPPQD